MNTVNVTTESFKNDETNNTLNKLGYKRIIKELSKLPMKLDDFIISSNYSLNNSSIYHSNIYINLKIKNFRNMDIKINNIIVPDDYPFSRLSLDDVNINISVKDKTIAILDKKNEVMDYFKNQLDFIEGFCDNYANSWSPALTIKTFSISYLCDFKFMLSKKLEIEKEVLIKNLIEYKKNKELNEVYLKIKRYLDDDLFSLKKKIEK